MGRHSVLSVLPPSVSSVCIWSCNTGFLCHSKWLPPPGGEEKEMVWGEMAEWSMAAVLKTAEGKPSVGSNPTLSAKFKHKKP